MAKKKKKHMFEVCVGKLKRKVMANGPGHAARIVFRDLINRWKIMNQPLSSCDGGWEGVTIRTL